MLRERNAAIFVFQNWATICYRMSKPKFASQRRKKRKFYGNWFAKHNQVQRVDVGNCSDGLEDWFKSRTTTDDHEKETLSAFYRKLKEDTEEKKSAVEPDETSTSNSRLLQPLDSLIWKFSAMCSGCWDVINVVN